MTFAEKLKTIRKQANLSQEQLAEKLGVSRQAITKWETDMGIPDIENIMAISELFHISVDELLSSKLMEKKSDDFLFESITEYDIAELKHYDMKLGGAKKLCISGYNGEKIHIRLASNTLTTLQSDFKIKIDDVKKRIDIDLHRKKDITEANAKEALSIFIQMPLSYIGRIECAINADEIVLKDLDCKHIELDVKSSNIYLQEVKGTVEINSNLDMNIECKSLNGAVAINQISATSRITIPDNVEFMTIKKGIKTTLSFEKDGIPSKAFSMQKADNVIELNGIKSELVISTFHPKE